MSEPGPESLPTSADPRSKRPTKRRAVTPHSEHASEIKTLFKDPTKELRIPIAAKDRTVANLSAPPEIVTNVQGSSAGAGSGEFHVYKASRRREYERLRGMQDAIDKEKSDEQWEKEREEAKKKDEEKTDKNRRRREKKKAARGKQKNGNAGDDGMDIEGPAPGMKKNPNAPGVRNGEQTAGADAQQAEEVPGVIIHDDD